MPVDYYVNQTVQQLEVLLAAAQQRKARGNVIEAMAAGVRTRREFASMRGVEDEIFNLRYSLFLRSAKTDSPYANPCLERIRRTRARYTFS
jgi:hypothetical protein